MAHRLLSHPNRMVLAPTTGERGAFTPHFHLLSPDHVSTGVVSQMNALSRMLVFVTNSRICTITQVSRTTTPTLSRVSTRLTVSCRPSLSITCLVSHGPLDLASSKKSEQLTEGTADQHARDLEFRKGALKGSSECSTFPSLPFY